MNYERKWTVERKLGQGGQGEVLLVRQKSPDETQLINELFIAWPFASKVGRLGEKEESRRIAAHLLSTFISNQVHVTSGALKLLHKDENARDPKRARERAAREIEAMHTCVHPNLLELLDFDAGELWYVSQFHPGGTLDQCLAKYKGNLLGTLTAVRPLVEGVSLIHERGVVHRDIKPHNVFISNDGRLVLGDFGLIYVPNLDESRISDTHSNVGTHAWMPGWAMEHRVTDLRPNFDVFSLGKVIWAMLSDKPALTLWYYDRPQNDVQKQFPGNPEMRHANELFAKCIVENEDQCLNSAADLLSEIDKTIELVSRGLNFFDSPRKICRVCHIGEYLPATSRERRNFNVSASGEFQLLMYVCNNCRNVELFYINQNSPPNVTFESTEGRSSS